MSPSPSTVEVAVRERLDEAVAFLARLAAQPSELGNERGVVEVFRSELGRLGFNVELLPIPDDIGSHPAAGVPQRSYDDRPIVVGRRGGGTTRSLLINGHLDVVPPGSRSAWNHPPYEPTLLPDGWMTARGAGDMKAGLAMALLAIEVADALHDTSSWDLTVVGVIEEECTGNGTLASIEAGVLADAVLIPEPTALTLGIGGVGVLWFDVTVIGRAAHAMAGEGTSALESLWAVKTGLERLVESFAAERPRHGIWDEQYLLNVGTVKAGDWRSSVPNEARMGVRLGFPTGWTAEEAVSRVRAAIAETAAGDAWLARHPPRLELTGFRAQGFTADRGAELVEMLAAAHAATHRESPLVTGQNGTNDARHYANHAHLPVVCFGPRARNAHAANEAVEIESVVTGAVTLAEFLPAWFGGGA